MIGFRYYDSICFINTIVIKNITDTESVTVKTIKYKIIQPNNNIKSFLINGINTSKEDKDKKY